MDYARTTHADLDWTMSLCLAMPLYLELSLSQERTGILTHRQDVKAMRQAALDTAAKWQWSDYRAKLIESINEGLQKSGYAK